jgi:hypothetical protein
VVDGATPEGEIAAELGRLWQSLTEVCAAQGLAPVGGEAARGQAAIPVCEETALQLHALLEDGQPVFDVNRAFNPRASAINADGMLAGARGSAAFADAFAKSEAPLQQAAFDALAAADEALEGIRLRNRASHWFFFDAPEALRTLVPRRLPRAAFRAYVEDFARGGVSVPR